MDVRAPVADPNVKRLEAFLEAYAANDSEAMGQALSDQAVWHVGGTHQFSGDYRGRDATLQYFHRVGAETGHTLALHPLELLANEHRGAAFLRVTADRMDRHLDVVMAEAFQFDEDGRIREFWAHATDQDEINRFWS
jgi:ketosteroid isomerase-like protein